MFKFIVMTLALFTLVAVAEARKLCLVDSLDNFYEMRINQNGEEEGSGNVYLTVSGVQVTGTGTVRRLVGAGEIFTPEIATLSFIVIDANPAGRNVAVQFDWDSDGIRGSLRRDGNLAQSVEVTDLGCEGR